MREKIELVILGATMREVEPLLTLLGEGRGLAFRGEKIWKGAYADRTLIVGTVGFNKVNAAITTAALLERFSISGVWHVGCAGAYREGPLRVGDVLISDRAICGDEGVLGRGGALPASEIGIPILLHRGRAFYDEIPLANQPVMERIKEQLPEGTYGRPSGNGLVPAVRWRDSDVGGGDAFRLFHGPSLTVGMASGDDFVARARFDRHGAFAENMEGSALAQACFRFDVPVVECRGMSNMAGDRQKANWRIEEAVSHSCSIVASMLEVCLISSSPP